MGFIVKIQKYNAFNCKYFKKNPKTMIILGNNALIRAKRLYINWPQENAYENISVC